MSEANPRRQAVVATVADQLEAGSWRFESRLSYFRLLHSVDDVLEARNSPQEFR